MHATSTFNTSGRQQNLLSYSSSAVHKSARAPFLAYLPRARRRQLQRLAVKCQIGTEQELVPQEVIEREAWKEVSAPCPSLHSAMCVMLVVARRMHISDLQELRALLCPCRKAADTG